NVGCGGSNVFYFSMRMQDDGCPAPRINLSTLVVTVLPGNTKPVELKCISYEPADASGVEKIRITWDLPPKDTVLSFNYYRVFGSKTRGGNYVPLYDIPEYDSLNVSISMARGYRHFYVLQSTGICDFQSPN